MATQTLRIGSIENAFQYDDGDYDSAFETTQPIKAGAPVDPNDVVILGGLPTIANLISSDAVITDHAIVRGDGGARKVQESNATMNDVGSITLPNGQNIGSVGTPTAIAIAATGDLTLAGNIVIPNAGNIGSVGSPSIVQLNATTVRIGDGGATNYVQINATGDVSFLGSATIWNDIYFPMSSGKIGGANTPSWDAFQGNTKEYTFGVNDYIHLPSQEIDHGYKEGSDLEFHVHVVTNGSDVGDTEVNYEVEYTIGDINEVMSAATIITSGDLTIPGGTADRTHLRINIATVAFPDLKSMAALKMRFRRIARVGGGADPGGDPFALMIGVHIEQDTIGSRTENAK